MQPVRLSMTLKRKTKGNSVSRKATSYNSLRALTKTGLRGLSAVGTGISQSTMSRFLSTFRPSNGLRRHQLLTFPPQVILDLVLCNVQRSEPTCLTGVDAVAKWFLLSFLF